MSTKEAKSRASKKWRAKATTQFKIQLHKDNDADIIHKLDSVPNKAGYVKGLIRDDIGREEENGQAICDTGQ